MLNDPSDVFDDYVWLLFYWLFVYKMEIWSFRKFKKDVIKINKLYEEFRQDELKTKRIHHPAKFEYAQPFEYRSKQMWFIERLFKKDKVDDFKLYDAWKKENRDFIYRKDDKSQLEKRICAVIMLLSVSEDPMKFLFTILK